ncbi:MAG TPA: hypothetical protein VFH39_03635 [Candidatus Saccharimonadales bacterium]|nr:hypothetical protein [Candidatus Saccharimonadales bacterium]
MKTISEAAHPMSHDWNGHPLDATVTYPRTESDDIAEMAERFHDDLERETGPQGNIFGLARHESISQTTNTEVTPRVTRPLLPRNHVEDGVTERNSDKISDEQWMIFKVSADEGRPNFLQGLRRARKKPR